METFTDDTVVALASFLSPHDMLSLALTCKRFGSKNGTTTSRSRRMAEREARKSKESGREVRRKLEPISLMEVAARTVLHAKWSDDEKNALPRHKEESWIGIYQEFLKLFRLPLRFDKLAGVNLDYGGELNKESVVCTDMNRGHGGFSSAICSNIMRAGRHSVSFNINNPTGDSGITLGIMRPTTEDITSLKGCYPAWENLSRFALKNYGSLHCNNIDCCLLSTCNGNAFCKKWNPHHHTDTNGWKGREGTSRTSFKLGFILDVDVGILDVYKNDRRLGTMMSGLVGEYCWVVSLRPGGAGDAKTVSINR